MKPLSSCHPSETQKEEILALDKAQLDELTLPLAKHETRSG
jgi:hypothetical protein